MTANLFLLACVILSVSVLVEFYKKDVRGYKAEDGSVKTKAGKFEVTSIAYGLSLIFAFPVYSVANFNLGLWLVIIYSFIIFAFQWILDESFVKQTIKSIVEKAIR